MGGARTGRLWTIIGALGSLVLLLLGWFLLIGPQNAETARLAEETATAEARVTSLRRLLSQLREQNADLPRFQSRLAGDRAALPTEAGMSDFLRELQKAGDSAGLASGGLTVGAPTKTSAQGAEIFAFPITLTATGSDAEWDRFLRRLQQNQPRAVLVNSVTVAPRGESPRTSDEADLTLGLQVFVAPTKAGGAGAPERGQGG